MITNIPYSKTSYSEPPKQSIKTHETNNDSDADGRLPYGWVTPEGVKVDEPEESVIVDIKSNYSTDLYCVYSRVGKLTRKYI